MPQDTPQTRVFTCFPCARQGPYSHHTCFHVSAVVSTSFDVVRRHCYFSRSGGLFAGSYVKTRAPSDGTENAPV